MAEWVRNQLLDILGFPANNEDFQQDPLSAKSSFSNILLQLLIAVKANKEKLDAKMMKPLLRKALYYFHQNKKLPLTEIEMTQLNELFDSNLIGIVKDEAFRLDLADLKLEHVQHWPDRYFMRWTDSYEEVDCIRTQIRKKWKEDCIDVASDTVAEPTRVVNRMDILLHRYALLTTFFLSPIKCLEEWRSLLRDKSLPEKLEEEIKRRSSLHIPKIQQLTTEMEATLLKMGIAITTNGPSIDKSDVAGMS